MRSTFAVLILAAACGGSDNKTPDASNHADAPKQIDAAADAAPDSAPDGMGSGSGSGAQSRVWVSGDFVTNNVTQAGWFTDGDTLPLTPTTVPAAPAVLPSGTGYSQVVFDATATATAFVADVTTAGTFDLYVAGADGSNPTLLVAGQPNIEIGTVSLSPDGTKVAFNMDSATYNNAYDVWVVNTTGTPVPVLVSPTRNLAAPDLTKLSAFGGAGALTWSSDSKWLGFSGDFNTDNHSQAYIVDTTAAVPMAVELYHDNEMTGATAGIRGSVLFDATDKAYFRASPDNAAFSFFQWDGTQRNTLALPARGDNSTSFVGPFAISPDGAAIVFSADAPTVTTYDLYSTAIATWNPVKLTNATVPNTNPLFTTGLSYSPDGTKVAFVADYVTDNVIEPFVANVDGSGTHRVVNVTVANADAIRVSWTVDGTGLYVLGDLETDGAGTLFRADPTMTDGTATKAFSVPASGSVFNTFIRAK